MRVLLGARGAAVEARVRRQRARDDRDDHIGADALEGDGSGRQHLEPIRLLLLGALIGRTDERDLGADADVGGALLRQLLVVEEELQEEDGRS